VVGDDVDPDPTPSASPTPSVSPTPSASPTADAGTDDGTDDAAADDTSSAVTQALADCQAAVSGTLDAQRTTDAQQRALLALATSLDDAVQALQKAQAESDGSTSDGSTSDGSTSDGSTSNGSTGQTSTDQSTGRSSQSSTSAPTTSPTDSSSGDHSSTPASAATVLADQAAIDLAEADLAVAQHQLAFVTLTSPVAGTVAAVSITPGASVGASSTTAVVTVLGTGGHTVATTVPLTSIDIVAVGQTATVTTPTTDETLTAEVTSIGVLDQSETSEPSYAVELALDPTDQPLYDGASAQVTITVADGDEVLTVPTSAVHVDGTTATVQVLKDGTPADVTVERGAVGAERTEIVSGLSLGDEVVLADTQQAVDTGSSSSSRGLSGLGDDGGDVQIEGGFGPPAGFDTSQLGGSRVSGGGGR